MKRVCACAAALHIPYERKFHKFCRVNNADSWARNSTYLGNWPKYASLKKHPQFTRGERKRSLFGRPRCEFFSHSFPKWQTNFRYFFNGTTKCLYFYFENCSIFVKQDFGICNRKIRSDSRMGWEISIYNCKLLNWFQEISGNWIEKNWKKWTTRWKISDR